MRVLLVSGLGKMMFRSLYCTAAASRSKGDETGNPPVPL
jgi:hypothetical protein